jgi:hypothetical protein
MGRPLVGLFSHDENLRYHVVVLFVHVIERFRGNVLGGERKLQPYLALGGFALSLSP